MRILKTALTALLTLAALGLAFVYSGLFNVAASKPHHPLTDWLFSTAMQQSVQRHAQTVTAPDLTADMAKAGFAGYDQMCVQCHGAPGVERASLGKGLTPQAPDLSQVVSKWSDEELFWIIKNGIKMTAMPAWGETHSEKSLWNVTAFVRRLPQLDPEAYQAIKREAQGKGHHQQ